MPQTSTSLLLLLLAGASTAHAYKVANGTADAVPTPMSAHTKYPQLAQVNRYTQMFAPELAAYVDDPATVCTIFAADNKAVENTMGALGRFVGIFMQNKTMQQEVLNHHVIPGKKIKAADLGTTTTAVLTRANQTLWFIQRNGQPYVSFAPEYVVPIEIADIQAGGCIMHIITNVILVPPTLLPLFEQWQTDAGNATRLESPQSQWRPAMAPLPGDVSAAAQIQNGNGPSAAAAPSPAAAGATSSVQSFAVSTFGVWAAAILSVMLLAMQ